MTEHRLAPCPRTPNCVSTEAADGPHAISPIPYRTSRDEALRRLLAILSATPRTTIVESDEDYVHAVCRSAVFRFADDVELLLDDAAKLIRFRSASRLGRKDFGVNRARMERIRARFAAGGDGDLRDR
jgi:uncharacterized protein (DUF1499 family)